MADIEKEITVKLKWSLDEAKLYFVNKGIPLIESYVLKDIYMIKDDVDIMKTPNLKILSQSIIIREVIGDENEKKIVCKNKLYDENGNIISSKRHTCPLVDIDSAFELLNAIGFKECFRYEQECLEYKSNSSSVILEYIPEIGLFLELENDKSVDGLIEELNELNIPYYDDNYFVKKAELMINSKRNESRCKNGRR